LLNPNKTTTTWSSNPHYLSMYHLFIIREFFGDKGYCNNLKIKSLKWMFDV